MKTVRTAPIVLRLPEWLSGPVALVKDLHVCVPIAFAGMVLMLFVRAVDNEGMLFIAPYAIACAAIGAMAVGHDFTYRTFDAVLSLPVSRTSLWAKRMFVGLCAITPLAICYGILGLADQSIGPVTSRISLTWGITGTFTALCLAPWLTLISRSPLFGTVFSLAVLPLVEVGATWAAAVFGGGAELVDSIRFVTLGVLWISGFALGWRAFLRLELAGYVDAQRLVRSKKSTARKFHRGSRVWQLVKKELRLQIVPIALATIAITFTLALKREQSELWTVAYPGLIIVLVGAMASAEERNVGVAEWQATLPILAGRQWATKFLISWLVALVFGAALPALAYLWKIEKLTPYPPSDFLTATSAISGGIFVIVAVTLYVSSLCSSGIKAVILGLVANAFVGYTAMQSANAYSDFVENRRGRLLWNSLDAAPFFLAALGIVGLLILFGMRNHRSADRSRHRILSQLLALAAYEVVAAAAIYAFWNSVSY